MRYSTRTRYGLRFLINLASRPEGTCVQLGEIAREEGVDKSAVRCSVKCGIEGMKKYLQENF